MRIAVIGSGISGLSAAWLLRRDHDITLYERESRLGGHSNTVRADHEGKSIPVDTGFIVYNEATYPNLIAMFDHLGVPTETSDMSFSVSVDDGALEYEGSMGGLAAQPVNLIKPWYWVMWRDIVRFYKSAPTLLLQPEVEPLSLGTYLEREAYGGAFREHHLLPMAAAIWSCPMDTMLAFPARSFIRFFVNHGLFNLGARPAWRTVSGGSRTYVETLAKSLGDRVKPDRAVVSIRRMDGGVSVTDRTGETVLYDQVVIAAHGDEALTMIADPTTEETRLLSAFTYQNNTAILHRDSSQMPRRRRAWAAWNYLATSGKGYNPTVSLTYWMNRLQNIDTRHPLFVTMNPIKPPDPELVFQKFSYDHPVFDQAAVDAQGELPLIQGTNRTWFCGSYCGYGFHEDGLKSGIAVARALGADIPWPTAVEPANQTSSLTAAPRSANQPSLAAGD
jgi:uncharacterized protein